MMRKLLRLLAAAADPASPLYTAFEWRNDVAAHHYRLQQAAEVVEALDAIEEPPHLIRLTAAREQPILTKNS